MALITQTHGEQSPLLGHRKSQDNSSIERGQDADIVEEENSNGEPSADEPTTKQLLMVMSGVWLGCILAGKTKKRKLKTLLIEP